RIPGVEGRFGGEVLAQPVEVALVEAAAQRPDRALQLQVVGESADVGHVFSFVGSCCLVASTRERRVAGGWVCGGPVGACLGLAGWLARGGPRGPRRVPGLPPVPGSGRAGPGGS